jgi:integrase
MKGSLIAIGANHWRLRCYTGERTINGHPRQASSQFRGTKRQAESALAQFVADVTRKARQERDPAKDNIAMAELLARWLEFLEPRRAPSTLLGYRRKIEGYVLPAIGNVRAAKLRAVELDALYGAMLRQGLAPATVRQVHAIISAALGQAVTWDWLAVNPAAKASAPRAPLPERGALPLADLKALGNEAEEAEGQGGVLPTAIALGALTGCRRGELCALRWSDIAGGKVIVRRSLTVTPGHTAEGPTKTGKSKHLVLDVVALEVLGRRRVAQEHQARTHDLELSPDAFVLSRADDGSTPCLPDGLTHAFGRLVEKLWPRPVKGGKPVGEPRWHFHDLRAWTATVMVGAGVDIKTAQARLGHATTAMLLDTYAKATTDADKGAAELVGVAFRG